MPHFTTLFDIQNAKRSQTQLKSGQQHFSYIFPSVWSKESWKMDLLVISEILGLFVNTMSADDKYCLHKEDNLLQSIEMQLSKNLKTFSEFCAPFLKSTFKFWSIWIKRWSSCLIYFENCWLSKTWLDKYLKIFVSEHRLKVNMLKGLKDCGNLHGSNVIVLLHHFEANRVGECLS